MEPSTSKIVPSGKILDLGFAFIRVGFKPSVSLAGFDSRLIQSLIDFPYAEKVQNKST